MSRLTKIKAISFDAAGTLIVPTPSVGVVYAEVMAGHGLKGESEWLEASFKKAFGSWRKNHSGTVLDQASWRKVVRETLADTCPPESFDVVFQELWDTFAEGRRWRILPGVLETLQRLKAVGYRLAVLSNNDERMHRVLKELELSPYFEVILASTQIGVEKPDRACFHAIEEAMSLPPAALLHVGDSIEEDIEGALGAGWQACYLGPEEKCPEGAFAVDPLPALCDHLPG